MTKSGLVTKVSREIGSKISKTECGSVVDVLLSSITEELAQGNSVEIRGFGTFKVRERKARMGRNPSTSEPVAIPARSVPVFTPSKNLRDRVDQGAAGS